MRVTLDVSGVVTGTFDMRKEGEWEIAFADDLGGSLALHASYERLEEMLMLALHALKQAEEQKVDVHFDFGNESGEPGNPTNSAS